MSASLMPTRDGRTLTLTISCTSDPARRATTQHLVTLHPDWTVTTQHDLDEERKSIGHDAYSSCLVFADVVVPAYRHILEVRHDQAAIRRDITGFWLNSESVGCPRWEHDHGRIADAVAHETSIEHSAGRYAHDYVLHSATERTWRALFAQLTRAARSGIDAPVPEPAQTDIPSGTRESRGLPPAPAGQDLTIEIPCTAAPGTKDGLMHPITIHPDWSVTTMHDLVAERVGREFGAWCSCLHFVDRVVPAYRDALGIILTPTQLESDGAWWQSSEPWTPDAGCEASEHQTRNLGRALAHEISPQHHAGRYGADRWMLEEHDRVVVEQYRSLMKLAGNAWAAAADQRVITDAPESVVMLWESGMLSTQIEAIARSLPSAVLPLSPAFYRQAHFEHDDIDWLCQAIGAFPDREIAEWAAHLDERTGQVDPAMLWRLWELQLSPRLAIDFIDSRIPIERLADLATRPGISAGTAARFLIDWERVGLRPTDIHYRVLEAHGSALLARPQASAVEQAVDDARRITGNLPDRTELAVMIALGADLSLIQEALRCGITAATDLRFLELIRKQGTR